MQTDLLTRLQREDFLCLQDIKQITQYVNEQQSAIPQAILHLNILSAEQLQQHLSKLFHLTKVDIHQFQHLTHYQQTDLTPLINKHHALPIKQENQSLTLAVADPSNSAIESDFRFLTGLQTELTIANFYDLSLAIEKLNQHSTSFLVHATHKEQATAEQLDDSVNEFIEQVIMDAVNRGASDIHFEPYKESYRIRVRCDGLLLETQHPPHHLSQRIASIIKIQAKLDITERRIPQDGRIFTPLANNNSVDLRVSTLPCIWGEKLVLRILNNRRALLTLDDLGLHAQQRRLFLNALHQSQGMILVTGPTGSGKTATLYAGLSTINSPQRNISTAEDPIEINVFGINQVQVNEKISLDFNAILRTLLRQDPDVIMLGEIRDKESAAIAIKAAQTGHLVLSTLHTNSAVDTLIRLYNMGIESYNLAASLSLVISQRLIRTLCPHCKQATKVTNTISLITGLPINSDIFSACSAGCNRCNNGYKGRIGVFEVLPMNNEIKAAITKPFTSTDILAIAQKQGHLTLQNSALLYLQKGETSVEELQRVLGVQ